MFSQSYNCLCCEYLGKPGLASKSGEHLLSAQWYEFDSAQHQLMGTSKFFNNEQLRFLRNIILLYKKIKQHFLLEMKNGSYTQPGRAKGIQFHQKLVLWHFQILYYATLHNTISSKLRRPFSYGPLHRESVNCNVTNKSAGQVKKRLNTHEAPNIEG